MPDYLEGVINRILRKIKFLFKVKINDKTAKTLKECKYLKFQKGRFCITTDCRNNILEFLECVLEMALVLMSIPILLINAIVCILCLIPKIVIVKKE